MKLLIETRKDEQGNGMITVIKDFTNMQSIEEISHFVCELETIKDLLISERTNMGWKLAKQNKKNCMSIEQRMMDVKDEHVEQQICTLEMQLRIMKQLRRLKIKDTQHKGGYKKYG